MGQFPIQYAEGTLPAKPDVVRADLDVRTGDIWDAVAGLGGSLFDLGQTIKDREIAADFSAKKRQIAEKGYAAFNAVTGDEEVDKVAWDAFLEDAGSIRSKYPTVNAELQEYINTVAPNWAQAIYKESLAIRAKQARDLNVLTGEQLLADGDLPEYYKQIHQRLATKDISQAEHDFLIENAPFNSVVLRAVKNSSIQGDVQTRIAGANRAIDILNSLSTKNLTATQVQRLNVLSNQLTQRRDDSVRELQDTTERQLLLDYHGGDLNDIEWVRRAYSKNMVRQGFYEAMERALAQPTQTYDPIAHYLVEKEINNIYAGTGTDEQAMKILVENASKLKGVIPGLVGSIGTAAKPQDEKADDPRSDFSARAIHAQLLSYKNGNFFIPELSQKDINADPRMADFLNTSRYLQMLTDFNKYISEQSRTPQEMTDWLEHKTRPVKEDKSKEWWQWLLYGRTSDFIKQMFAKKTPPHEAKVLTEGVAREYLRRANGNRVVAQELAKEDGYTW